MTTIKKKYKYQKEPKRKIKFACLFSAEESVLAELYQTKGLMPEPNNSCVRAL